MPRSGRGGFILLDVRDSQSGQEVLGGRTSCQAFVAGSTLLAPTISKFASGLNKYECAWRVPSSSAGARFRAVGTVTAEGQKVSTPTYKAVVRSAGGPKLVFPLAPLHGTPVAGQNFQASQSARLQFPDGSQISWNARGGSGSCSAHIAGGGSLAPGKEKTFPTGIQCTWSVPRGDRGQLIVFVMTFHALGQTKSSQFSARAS